MYAQCVVLNTATTFPIFLFGCLRGFKIFSPSQSFNVYDLLVWLCHPLHPIAIQPYYQYSLLCILHVLDDFSCCLFCLGIISMYRHQKLLTLWRIHLFASKIHTYLLYTIFASLVCVPTFDAMWWSRHPFPSTIRNGRACIPYSAIAFWHFIMQHYIGWYRIYECLSDIRRIITSRFFANCHTLANKFEIHAILLHFITWSAYTYLLNATCYSHYECSLVCSLFMIQLTISNHIDESIDDWTVLF